MTSGRSLNGIAAAVVVALTGVTLGLDAQVTNLRIEPVAPTVPPPAACLAPSRPSLDNGIGVGDPKVFDNRSLALMLDTLNESLRNLHVVDSKSLTTNLGVLQGYQQDSVARSFSLQGAPLSGVTETAKATQQASTGSA